jgi:membrane protease YdiL (CAAX protease family)
MEIDYLEQQQPQTSFPPKLWNRTNGLVTLAVFIILYFGLSLTVGLFFTAEMDPFWITFSALLSNALACFGSVLLVNLFFKKHSLTTIGFRKTTLTWIVIALAAGIGLMVLRALLAGLMLLIFPSLMEGTEILQDAFVTNNTSLASQLTTLLLGGFLIPIGEELFFRGFLHNWLRNRFSMWPAILISAFVFSAFHLIPLQVLLVFPMGVMTAWLYEKSKSLTAPIALHIINNAIALSITIAASYLV